MLGKGDNGDEGEDDVEGEAGGMTKAVAYFAAAQ